MTKADLLSMDMPALTAFIKEMGESAFRAKQVRAWLNRGAVFSQMTNLSADFRARLDRAAVANPVRIEKTLISKLDGTAKFLFLLADENIVEGVLMRYHHGDTVCISTQVGCKMGCKFCASTIGGCVRSLSPGEMLGQVIAANVWAGEGRGVRNIVLMGSGEPLDNYDAVVRFLRLVNDAEGLNISLRNVSVSTCGLVPEMIRLASEGLPVTLSVSLHAPNDEIRRSMMPIAAVYPMADVLAACRHYIERTGRRVIFEYALVEGVNCEMRHADELSARLRGMQCHVNLIPLNSVRERALAPPDRRAADAFLGRLKHNRISATIRREMGADIEGACGQLRRRALLADDIT
ncbi:MAG: 23S rRNA (adenine(2503)-C(2))-methyltransferase RlmN [Christensenellales bacterium]|jgi:23S rRNA (adenine2503-C2)-methyltransferase